MTNSPFTGNFSSDLEAFINDLKSENSELADILDKNLHLLKPGPAGDELDVGPFNNAVMECLDELVYNETTTKPAEE